MPKDTENIALLKPYQSINIAFPSDGDAAIVRDASEGSSTSSKKLKYAARTALLVFATVAFAA